MPFSRRECNLLDWHLEPGYVWAIAPGRLSRRCVTEREAIDWFHAVRPDLKIGRVEAPQRGRRKVRLLLTGF